MVLPSLKEGGYEVNEQVLVGTRLGGRKHWVDAVATKKGVSILVSMKWQQVGGSAEQKVPFEVICLVEAIKKSGGKYQKAYLVLGGAGWSLRDLYVSGALEPYLKHGGVVEIVSFEQFIAKANKGKL